MVKRKGNKRPEASQGTDFKSKGESGEGEGVKPKEPNNSPSGATSQDLPKKPEVTKPSSSVAPPPSPSPPTVPEPVSVPPVTPNGGAWEESTVVGIDLGTTYSCVSVWRNGAVEVLANTEGERTTPSWVAFTEDGERLVGQQAKTQAARNSSKTLFNIKRIIGQTYSDCLSEIKQLPFTVKEDRSSGMPLIEVEYGGKVHNFTPEQISAMVLEKVKASAEVALGHPIKKAVVTVPAYFNDAQRRSTKIAGAIAGLEVERIINEPTAAALAYGLDKKGQGTILIFDLGGGTFDVSLLRIEEGIFKVLSTAGDTHLGGEDFDYALQEHVREQLRAKQGSGGDLFSDNPKALRQLRSQCEKAKRALSSSTSAMVEVSVGGREWEFEVTRSTFEKLNEKLFEKCLASVRRVLEDGKVSKDNVDEIVLVGGSTRIPKVQQLLSEMFSGKALCKSVNPDEAVAYGAAVQGAILSGIRDKSMMQLVLLDVIPLTMGIETEGRVFAKVVPRNTAVPCSKTREFTTVEDYQEEMDIAVYEGERGCTDGNHLLGKFQISGIERAKQGVAKVEVSFHINANGLLTVAAKDRVTGAAAKTTIKDRTRHSDADVERMIQEAAKMRLEDERRAREVEGEQEEDLDLDDDDKDR